MALRIDQFATAAVSTPRRHVKQSWISIVVLVVLVPCNGCGGTSYGGEEVCDSSALRTLNDRASLKASSNVVSCHIGAISCRRNFFDNTYWHSSTALSTSLPTVFAIQTTNLVLSNTFWSWMNILVIDLVWRRSHIWASSTVGAWS